MSLWHVYPVKLQKKEHHMKTILYTLLVSALLLTACAPSATPTPAVDPAGSTMPALTDPSQPITVTAGEIFTIVMDSNPSTGYHWEVSGALDEAHLELVSREYTGSEPVLPGSGGVDVWTFKAVAAGETTLTLGNYPPGDGTTSTQETQFSITIK